MVKRILSFLFLLCLAVAAWAQSPAPVPVTVDNFIRAESDRYFEAMIKRDGFGKIAHSRELRPINQQTIIRPNRDTLYSRGVFDLDAGPVTVTLPDPGKRYMSLQVIDEDDYTPLVAYGAGSNTISREQVGTRYAVAYIRTLVDPTTPRDLDQAHALQDTVKVEQKNSGRFEVPNWDQASHKKVRDALLVLGSTVPDSKGMYGVRGQVDPVRHLIGTAYGWGGFSEKDATYLNITPARNDGAIIYRLTVGDVPVDGFWSVSVYNLQGYFEPNKYNAYTLNNLTAKKNANGSTTIQFGGCDGKIPNCLPTIRGWNYAVRLYRPRAEILNGQWKFPEAKPAS
jgi:hypothetical protein